MITETKEDQRCQEDVNKVHVQRGAFDADIDATCATLKMATGEGYVVMNIDLILHIII